MYYPEDRWDIFTYYIDPIKIDNHSWIGRYTIVPMDHGIRFSLLGKTSQIFKAARGFSLSCWFVARWQWELVSDMRRKLQYLLSMFLAQDFGSR